MKIGELSRKTGVSARMLRYYEEMGLITPNRASNGYRDYDDYFVERVRKISGLADSGVPIRLIGNMMPCLNQPQEIIVRDAEPELFAMLTEQRNAMAERVATLENNLAALDRYITAMGAALFHTGAGEGEVT